MVSLREVLGVLGVRDTVDGLDFGYLGPATAMDALILVCSREVSHALPSIGPQVADAPATLRRIDC